MTVTRGATGNVYAEFPTNPTHDPQDLLNYPADVQNVLNALGQATTDQQGYILCGEEACPNALGQVQLNDARGLRDVWQFVAVWRLNETLHVLCSPHHSERKAKHREALAL